LLLKENQKKISSRKSKVLGANRNLLAFLKTIILQSTQNTFPQFWNCFIRNGSSDELHEFRKVLNPEMTDAYFYQKHLCSPVWVREVLAEA
jgi:hypothetical protein